MAWIKIISKNDQEWPRIFDFGNGQDIDNMIVSNAADSKIIRFRTLINSSSSTIVDSPNEFKLNEWFHIAVSVIGTTATLYIDGVEEIVKTGKYPFFIFMQFFNLFKSLKISILFSIPSYGTLIFLIALAILKIMPYT